MAAKLNSNASRMDMGLTCFMIRCLGFRQDKSPGSPIPFNAYKYLFCTPKKHLFLLRSLNARDQRVTSGGVLQRLLRSIALAMASSNSSCWKGLVTKPSMPASVHRSNSVRITFAVTPTIGTRARSPSKARMARVAA